MRRPICFAAALGIAMLAGGCAAPQAEAPTMESSTIVGDVGDPRNRARVHTELAALYYSRNNMGVALEELRTAVAADASYAPAHGVFGLVYMELRENQLAEASFERALRLAPNDSEINQTANAGSQPESKGPPPIGVDSFGGWDGGRPSGDNTAVNVASSEQSNQVSGRDSLNDSSASDGGGEHFAFVCNGGGNDRGSDTCDQDNDSTINQTATAGGAEKGTPPPLPLVTPEPGLNENADAGRRSGSGPWPPPPSTRAGSLRGRPWTWDSN